MLGQIVNRNDPLLISPSLDKRRVGMSSNEAKNNLKIPLIEINIHFPICFGQQWIKST